MVDQLRGEGVDIFLDSEGECVVWANGPAQVGISSQFLQYWEPIFKIWPKVESIEFSNMTIRPDVVSQIELLAPVCRVRLENCKIGAAEWKRIQGLDGLRFLDVEDTPIEDLEVVRLRHADTLEFLGLDNVGASVETFESLKGFSRLRVLDLSRNPIGNEVVPIVASLPKLRTIGLDDTNIDDDGLKALAKMHRLKYIGSQAQVRVWRCGKKSSENRT